MDQWQQAAMIAAAMVGGSNNGGGWPVAMCNSGGAQQSTSGGGCSSGGRSSVSNGRNGRCSGNGNGSTVGYDDGSYCVNPLLRSGFRYDNYQNHPAAQNQPPVVRNNFPNARNNNLRQYPVGNRNGGGNFGNNNRNNRLNQFNQLRRYPNQPPVGRNNGGGGLNNNGGGFVPRFQNPLVNWMRNNPPNCGRNNFGANNYGRNGDSGKNDPASKPTPPQYYGKPTEDFADWYRSYEAYQAYKGNDDDRKLQMLQYALCDFASETLSKRPVNQNQAAIDAANNHNNAVQNVNNLVNIPVAIPHNYASTIEYLRGIFITQGVPTNAMEKFCNLRQRPGQDISSYYYEFEKLVKAVYQDRDPDEDFVFKKFLSSLYGDYKRLMLMKNPQTLKEALDESRRLESNGCTGMIDQPPDFYSIDQISDMLNNCDITVGNGDDYPDDGDGNDCNDDNGDNIPDDDCTDDQINYPVNLNDYSWDELVDYFSGFLPDKVANSVKNDQNQSSKLPDGVDKSDPISLDPVDVCAAVYNMKKSMDENNKKEIARGNDTKDCMSMLKSMLLKLEGIEGKLSEMEKLKEVIKLLEKKDAEDKRQDQQASISKKPPFTYNNNPRREPPECYRCKKKGHFFPRLYRKDIYPGQSERCECNR